MWSGSAVHLYLCQSSIRLAVLLARRAETSEMAGTARYCVKHKLAENANLCFKSWQSCFKLTDAIYGGLDLKREIHVVDDRGLGDTLLLWQNTDLTGLAICHYGLGTEAGSDTCHIKFGAVRPGVQAGQIFKQLLEECETLGRIQGVSRLGAGINTGQHIAYQQMLTHGFQTTRVGIAMHNPNDPAYHQPDIFVLDEWR